MKTGLLFLSVACCVACSPVTSQPDAVADALADRGFDGARADAAVVDGASEDAAAEDGSADSGSAEGGVAVDRGPTRVAMDGDPNGLWWERSNATLYIADDQNNRVLTWRDGEGQRLLATLPPAPSQGAGLGQLVRMQDGTIVVARFGHGTSGDVVYIAPDGTVGRISTLDVTRRRIGLTVASDGTLYDGWFVRQASGRVGSVSTLTLAGAESDAITGLAKPVGVLAVGARLFVSDQDRNEILVADRASPMTTTRFAMLTGPDLLCEGPSGSLFSGSTTGVVYRIASDGAVTTFDTGYQSTRGVAYDRENRRLFVADHDTNSADGVTNQLRIVPVEQ